MASIDKVYGTKKEFDELYAWCRRYYPKSCNYLYSMYWQDESCEWFYDGKEHPISNFPELVDMWMLDNCPIEWVVNRIKGQYGMNVTSNA